MLTDIEDAMTLVLVLIMSPLVAVPLNCYLAQNTTRATCDGRAGIKPYEIK